MCSSSRGAYCKDPILSLISSTDPEISALITREHRGRNQWSSLQLLKCIRNPLRTLFNVSSQNSSECYEYWTLYAWIICLFICLFLCNWHQHRRTRSSSTWGTNRLLFSQKLVYLFLIFLFLSQWKICLNAAESLSSTNMQFCHTEVSENI